MNNQEPKVTTTSHWEYLGLTGRWLEPDISDRPDEAVMRANELGTAYRHVITRESVQQFDINPHD